MIMEALRWYAESLSAFWVSLAGGGLFRLILIGCLIYWICCRRSRSCCRGGRCRCTDCGCRSGNCGCGEDDEGAEATA